MEVGLSFFAGLIFVLYSFYFSRIITGNPEQFEMDMLRSLADWMIKKGAASKSQLWFMLLSSFMLELGYFYLVLVLIKNPVLLLFTWTLAGIEIIHLSSLFIAFYRFFTGKLILKDIFKWSLERVSAFLFFTHSLLVILAIWLF